MTVKKNVWAIIPARGGSQGIKRKNIKKVNGIPLVVHAINQAMSAKNIQNVLVSTEDIEIAEIAKNAGSKVMDRSDEFINDNSIQEVDRLLIWTVNKLIDNGEKVDVIVLLYPTAPLRKVSTIEDIVARIIEEDCDSALTLYEDTTYLWAINENGEPEPLNYDPKTRGPRQKEKWNQWGENKAVYAMTRELLLNTGCRLGGKIGWVEMSKLESIDIDKKEDLILCDVILKMNLID